MRGHLGIVLVAVALIGTSCGDEPATTVATTAVETTTVATMETADIIEVVPAADVQSPSSGTATTGSLLLLADDFQDGDAVGWDVDYGWYAFGAGNEVRMAASRSAWMWWSGGEEWETGYVLRASIRIDAGGLAVATAVGPEGRYVVHLHADGTDLLLDRPWGTFETLATAPPVAPGEWHALAVGVQDDQLHVYVDGEPLAAATVDRPLVAGSVGFGALDGSIVAFDNVYVTVLRGTLPALAPSGPSDPAPSAAADPVVEEPPDDGDDPQGNGDYVNLSATFVWFASQYQVAGEPFGLGVNVSNTGTIASGPFEVVWEAQGSACTASIDGLAPGEAGDASCQASGLPAGLHTWTAYVDHDQRIAESSEADNILSGPIEVAAAAQTKPDLGFIDGNPANPNALEPYELWVIVSDQNGVGFTSPFTTRFLLDGQLLCSVDKTGDLVQPRCTIPGLDVGSHLMEVVIDPENEIIETREDNNSWMWEIEIAPLEPMADLWIRGIYLHPEAGQPFTVQLFVENANEAVPVGAYHVWFAVDGTRVCNVSLQGTPSSPLCDFPALSAGDHHFRFVVDGPGVVDEFNEDNNTLTIDEHLG